MDITTTKKAIQRLENLNASDEFAYEEAVIAFLSIGKVPIIVHDLPVDASICRARTHAPKEEFFYVTDDIFVPPIGVIKSFARCNKPHQLKLYGSETRPIAYDELLKTWMSNHSNYPTLYVTVGKWIVKDAFNLILVTSPDQHLRSIGFDKYYGDFLDKSIAAYDAETRECFTLFYRFLFSKFRKEVNESIPNDIATYIITSAYCNIALNLTRTQCNGIVYPSVPSKHEGLNFAFNSEVSKYDHFKLDKVYRNEFAITKTLNSTNFREVGILEAISFDTSNNEISW